MTPPADETRPRRAADEPQDDKPLKLKADLVTVITSVTDSAGNQINDLTQKDFELYEDGVVQDIAGFYREGQIPLRLIFLFDTSRSIEHRFAFEQRAAAHFFRNVMRSGDQAALMSVSSEAKIEMQFSSDVDQLVNGIGQLKAEGATALYDGMITAARYLRPSDGRHVMVVLSDGTDTASRATLVKALTEAQESDAIIYGVHSTPFWLDRDRMDGWMLTFLSIRDLALLATFFSLVAIAVEAAHSLKLLDWVPQSVLARTALRDGEPIHEVT